MLTDASRAITVPWNESMKGIDGISGRRAGVVMHHPIGHLSRGHIPRSWRPLRMLLGIPVELCYRTPACETKRILCVRLSSGWRLERMPDPSTSRSALEDKALQLLSLKHELVLASRTSSVFRVCEERPVSTNPSFRGYGFIGKLH